jgi:hypothetical protein
LLRPEEPRCTRARAIPFRLGPALGVLALSIVCSACGLEDFPGFLSQPDEPLAGGDYFQFEATADNSEDDFRGFELYYKIYDPVNPSLIVDDQANIAVFDNLSTRGYRRINGPSDRVGNIARPLILVDPTDDKGKHFTVKVAFQASDLQQPPYPRIEVDEDIAEPLVQESQMEVEDLRRGVNYRSLPYNTSEYKGFNDFVEPGDVVDGDITYDSDIWTAIDSGQPATLVLYVVSYGLYVPDNRQLYSQPLMLGEIGITFPENNYP